MDVKALLRTLAGIVVLLIAVLAVRKGCSCLAGWRPEECRRIDPCLDKCATQFEQRGSAGNPDVSRSCIEACEKEFGARAQDCPR